MADTSMNLDKWREYFRSSNSDIFHVIERAIIVASSDYPYDFKLKRDRIAEMLFTSKVTRCFSCDRIELAVPNADGVGKLGKCKSLNASGGSKDTKESKTNSSRGDVDHRESMKMNGNHVSNYCYWDAEALTDEIEEQSQIFDEVLRIKEILDNNEEESDEVLFDSLRWLQLMHLSLEILKATDIGKSVKVLWNHGSKEIQNLVKALIEDWRIKVDAWLNTTAAIAGVGVETESVKTSVEEEEGLPSPPLDEGAFFTTHISMELSQFFDGMDDDGNPQNSGEFIKNREDDKRPTHEKPVIPKRKLENPNNSSTPPTSRRVEQKKNQQAVLKKQDPSCKPFRPQNGESRLAKPKPPISESGAMRPKPAIKATANNEVKVQKKPNEGTIQKKPTLPQQKLDCNNETTIQKKLEAAKRKLQERYQEAENAKKQRTVQVLEFRDLPKKILLQRNHQHMRPVNCNKNRVNGRV